MPPLNPEQLIAAAEERTALNNWGDPSFRIGVDHLVESLQREARLSQMGQYAVEAALVDRLVNRLQLIDYRQR
ncbi:MAG: sulfotransferase family protein, partial [Deltaproteobacteria bacterium]|nr:sulfotransferase family protein [Deltaproteobacteria bacterium]